MSFFQSYKANLPQHLSDEEFETLTNFSKNNLKGSLLIKQDKSILNKKKIPFDLVVLDMIGWFINFNQFRLYYCHVYNEPLRVITKHQTG